MLELLVLLPPPVPPPALVAPVEAGSVSECAELKDAALARIWSARDSPCETAGVADLAKPLVCGMPKSVLTEAAAAAETAMRALSPGSSGVP